jgi:hypothetical protein
MMRVMLVVTGVKSKFQFPGSGGSAAKTLEFVK